MTNERDSVRIALEAILLLLYAWNYQYLQNSCRSWPWIHLPNQSLNKQTFGIDIIPFQFLIILQRSCHPPQSTSWSCPITPPWTSGLSSQAHQLMPSRPTHLFNRQHCIRLTCSLVRCMKGARWQVNLSLHWTMANHCFSQSCIIRARALFSSQQEDEETCFRLIPIPIGACPFEPIDGPDNWYGQLHKPITVNPYKEAGIKGFTPSTPFKATSQFLTTDLKSQFHWPSLSEPNNNLFTFQWLSEEERKWYFDGNLMSSIPIMHIGPLPAAPIYNNPTIPSISTLTTAIIKSPDKLFFISNPIGTNDAQ